MNARESERYAKTAMRLLRDGESSGGQVIIALLCTVDSLEDEVASLHVAASHRTQLGLEQRTRLAHRIAELELLLGLGGTVGEAELDAAADDATSQAMDDFSSSAAALDEEQS